MLKIGQNVNLILISSTPMRCEHFKKLKQLLEE